MFLGTIVSKKWSSISRKVNNLKSVDELEGINEEVTRDIVADIGLFQIEDPLQPVVTAMEDCRLECEPFIIGSQLESEEYRSHLALQHQLREISPNLMDIDGN